LITVHDKTGVEELASYLAGKGVEIISTKGTYEFLKARGVPVKSVSEYSDDGILADKCDDEHISQMIAENIPEIDMIVVNFCPFKKFAENVYDEYELVQKIDIGGINLVRAAAKNYRNVLPIVDTADYKKVISSFELCGDIPLQNRRRYALKAFYNTMKYEENIHQTLSFLFAEEKYEHMTFERLDDFKYGDNPHQLAYFSKVADADTFFENIEFLVKKRFTLRLYKQIYSGMNFMRNITSNGFTILVNFVPVYFSTEENDIDYMNKINEELKLISDNNAAFISKGVVNEITADFIINNNIKVVFANSYDQAAADKLKKSDIDIVAKYDEFKTANVQRLFFENELVVQELDKVEDFGALENVFAPENSEGEYSFDLLILSQIIRALDTCSLVRLLEGKLYGMASGTLNSEEGFALCEKRFKLTLNDVKGGILGFDIFPSAETVINASENWGIEALLIPDDVKINETILEIAKLRNIALYTYKRRHYK
jgi:phosphoribosylaminoimidazolecarboxamide formyltransferase/IMP cyclohydrolase